MVGSPHQTGECLAKDMKFIEEFQPQMVGIGPFIPQHDTPFKDEEAGSLGLTVYLLGPVSYTHLECGIRRKAPAFRNRRTA